MAQKNCSACDDLRNDAPNFVVNGLTNTEIASLKNNTGLNPSNSNNDCTDLNNMNDCLIGNMEEEVELYDVCDWKDYTKELVGNLWTMFAGIIASICGIWSNIASILKEIASLKKKNEELCELIDQIVNPSLLGYGTLPLADTSAMRARRCGTATNKVYKKPDDGSLNPYTKMYQNIGISYASITKESCSSSREEMIEWIAPSHYLYELVAGAEYGDVLWKISKSEAQSVIGISDYLWQAFSESSWTWTQTALSPSRQLAWIEITVGDSSVGLGANEMGVVFRGCTAPNDAISSNQTMSSFNNSFARAYRHIV